MATRYFTLDTATTPATLLPLALPIAVGGRLVIHPTPAQAAQFGAYPRNDSTPAQAATHGAYPRNDSAPAPTPPEGKVAVPDSWEVRDGAWVRSYAYEDAPPPALAEYDAAMEDHLVQERTARGYTTREPDAYLASANPRWAQDARDWVAHRDAVMAYALELVNAVESGRRLAPTMAEFRAGLPRITWSHAD